MLKNSLNEILNSRHYALNPAEVQISNVYFLFQDLFFWNESSNSFPDHQRSLWKQINCFIAE
jgi:hypothetical protein